MAPLDVLKSYPAELPGLQRWAAGLRTACRKGGISIAQLAICLGVDRQVVYRRLRNPQAWSAYDIARLSRAFGLTPPFDADRSSRLCYEFPFGLREGFHPHLYIERYVSLAREVVAVPRRGNGDEPLLEISTTDLPIFPLFVEPIIVALKLFIYRGGGAGLDREFDYEAIARDHAAFLSGAAELAELYSATNSVEVWGRHPLASLLRQIGNLVAARAIDDYHLDLVRQALRRCVNVIRDAIKTGRKSGGGSFELSVYDLESLSTSMTAVAPQTCLTFATVRNPLFAVSRDPQTCQIQRGLFADIRRLAHPVGLRGENGYRAIAVRMLSAVDEVTVGGAATRVG